MNQITNPHDKFFKEVFTRRETAMDFLRNYLPPEVVDLLDLDTLEFVKDTFVDKHLKEYFSDLLCKTYLKDGSPGLVYILFEHKSYQERLTAFHLLRYMVKIWEQWIDTKDELGFPLIIPLLLYHGEYPWRVGLNFSDLFHRSDAMLSYVPDFQYVLWDASRYNDDGIKGAAVLRAVLLLFKYIFSPDLRDRIPDILRFLTELSEKRTALEYIEAVLRYIANAAPDGNISYDDLKTAVEETLPDQGGEIMPTIADALREQGKQEGIQQGMQQGMLQKSRDDVIDILELRFEIVPRSILKVINEINDPSILKSLLKKAVTVKSLDEFGRIIDLVMK